MLPRTVDISGVIGRFMSEDVWGCVRMCGDVWGCGFNTYADSSILAIIAHLHEPMTIRLKFGIFCPNSVYQSLAANGLNINNYMKR